MHLSGTAAPERILVVKLATLGDLLTATPAVRALRTAFPRAHLAVLTTPSSTEALRGLPTVDEVISFDKFAFDRPFQALRSLPHALDLKRQLRAGNWDALVLLHHLTTPLGVAKYAALALASGAPIRAGLDNGRGWFLTHRAVDRGFGWRHEADYWLAVSRSLGAEPPAHPRLELAIDSSDESWAAARWEALGLRGRVALVAPGSGFFSRARRWSPERFAEVARALRDQPGWTPVILSGLAEEEAQLAAAVAAMADDAPILSPAPTPQALAAFVSRCGVLVANDSGPVHVATTVGTPVVAIFGPTNDAAWGPYPADDARHAVVREPLVCAPCIHRGHDFGDPRGCPARTCLALVETKDVLAAVERVTRPARAETPSDALAGAA